MTSNPHPGKKKTWSVEFTNVKATCFVWLVSLSFKSYTIETINQQAIEEMNYSVFTAKTINNGENQYIKRGITAV